MPEYPAGQQVIRRGDETVNSYRITTMADAMELAMQTARHEEDEDPDPYGFASEAEQEMGVELLQPQWKALPGDPRWEKRLKGRARRAAVAKLFLQGNPVSAIAVKVQCSEPTVYRDLATVGQEWRRSYLGDIEVLAGKDLARLDYLLLKLAPGIERGDTKSITAAVDIIKERGGILGYRQGVQVDITAYIREVAEAAGFDPDKAVELAGRLAVNFK